MYTIVNLFSSKNIPIITETFAYGLMSRTLFFNTSALNFPTLLDTAQSWRFTLLMHTSSMSTSVILKYNVKIQYYNTLINKVV